MREDRGLRPGLYEDLTTERLDRALSPIDPALIERKPVDPADATVVLGRYVADLVGRALAARTGDAADDVARQVDLANQLIRSLRSLAPDAFDGDEEVGRRHDMLFALLAPSSTPDPPRPPDRPATPLSSSALLVNGRDQPNIGAEVIRELASAESVDLLSAFIKWHGMRLVEGPLRTLRDRGGRIRVITTTYMGATDRRALDALRDLGADIKVSYDLRTTRLHAKAWLFHRGHLTTAYVGSSNLSRTALTDGLEWNVRLSAIEQPHLIDTIDATFDDYWNDPAFETYDASSGARFDAEIAAARGPKTRDAGISPLVVRPYPYQTEVLERLEAERTIHARWRNLVVMATGTGKTVVSALDYRRLRDVGRVDSLLFVAHRKEILEQSLRTFREVMRDGAFGELYVDGRRPDEWRHVFASIQSLTALDLTRLDPRRFSMVVVDEFHHAEAATYERLLSHLEPEVLLGLTATPERTDEKDVTRWFGGRIAVELRLWEALERNLLSPFQYFGVADDVDVSGVTWRRGRYDLSELSGLYSGNEARAAKVVEAVGRTVGDVGSMRALGFCVSVDHARFMAERFKAAGIPATAVSAGTSTDEREAALRDLGDRRINVVFAVDLFNEGVDVPEVDTVLFLRPTESATLFLQQLGRGLRLADGKACLTVLDFIGNQRAEFRFDRRFRALTGTTRANVQRQIENGFTYLPPGCAIRLDRVARQIVLDNVRRSLRLPWRELARDLRSMGASTDLRKFLEETGLDLEDIYRKGRSPGWQGLLREAGLAAGSRDETDTLFVQGIRRLLHVDDAERLALMRTVSAGPSASFERENERARRLRAMLHFSLWGANTPIEEADERLARLATPGRMDELGQVTTVLDDRRPRVTYPLTDHADVPLEVHARYTRDEIAAAFGVMNPASFREGVRHVPAEHADLLLVTLNKTEEHFSPTTMYRDRAITPSLFQWESQSTTSLESPTGQRYLHHDREGTSVHLFIRESKDSLLGIAAPYLYAGPAHYRSHHNERPIEIHWELERDLPADVFHAARAVAG
jgi:superfamily II DNA or RNA helicase